MASASAGSIFIDLLLRDAQYKEGLSKAQKRVKDFVSGAKKEIAILGNVMKGTAVLSAGIIANKFIQNTINAQKEQAQLAAVLRSTGNAAGYTINQLNAMASAMSANSIFSSGDINSAQTRLLSYVGIVGTNVPRAMQAVIDQSSRLGISLEQSAETIGRALEQPSKAAAALSRQGFGSYFTKETVEMLKSLERQGKVAEAQVKILEVLDESYKGAALAARDTFGGALANLNNVINDLTTSDEGLPELTALINGVSDALRVAAKEGGVLNSIVYRMSIGFLELKKAYNEFRLSFGDPLKLTPFAAFSYLDDVLNGGADNKYKKNIEDAINAQDILIRQMEDRQELMKVNFDKPALAMNNIFTPEVDIKAIERIQSLYSKYESIITGISKELLDLRDVEKDLNELRKAGKISQEEMTTALERYKQQMDSTSLSAEDFAKKAAENIQDAFADFLFDPFQDGLKGMAKGFIDTVRRMIAEAQAAKLASFLFGDMSSGGSKGGGILSSALSGLFDGFFADGGNIKPGHFGIAGEAGPELIVGGNSGKTVIPLNGNSGGNTYNIDARGADISAVRRLEQALLSLAGPGVIAQRVQNDQIRGKL